MPLVHIESPEPKENTVYKKVKRLLIGAPIPSHHSEEQKLNVPLGLAVFASDALSSTAYATDEILIALAGSSYAAFTGLLSLPVAIAIAVLIVLVVISYRQIIRAYPEGGGAYIVARENLGTLPSHIAASALLIDYVLTVAVSISAGVAALTSTGLFPHQYTTSLCILFTVGIMIINLRGVKESGIAFAFPAYAFLFSMASLIGAGLWKLLSTPHVSFMAQVASAHSATGTNVFASVGFAFIFLKAFSHGCAGLTGIEAVSNGVKAFKEPRPDRANKTMTLMGLLLGGIFLGITYLAFGFHILPQENETILSQVARAVFGGGTFFYLLVQFSTMILLILAANTAFADFPRVSSLLADDGYLPRQLMNLGDRLVFNNGIAILGILSIFLIILFKGDTHALIPLYAVGVFVSFTCSQTGMVVHHRREKHTGWQQGVAINALGAVVTAIVTIILAVEKFREGAWIVFVISPLLIYLFKTVKHHYIKIGKQLALPVSGYCPIAIEHTVLVLVSSLNRGTIPALEYAKTISERVEAVHINLNPKSTEQLKRDWEKWGCGIPLTILASPYRSITEPLLEYIDEVEDRYEHDLVTIIVPEFVTKKWWHNLLHNQTALLLKAILRFRPGKVVTTVRYHLEE
jgi:amino acid transporter